MTTLDGQLGQILCNKFHNSNANPKTALELVAWIWMHLSLNLINFSEVNLHHTCGKSGMHTCKQETYLKAKKWQRQWLEIAQKGKVGVESVLTNWGSGSPVPRLQVLHKRKV